MTRPSLLFVIIGELRYSHMTYIPILNSHSSIAIILDGGEPS